MKLFRFILGVLGVLLVIGAFSSFIPLVFLGGLASGSVGFAFFFPIFLIVVGAAMIYFGFYYQGFNQHNNSKLIWIVKWGLVHSIGVFIGNLIVNKLVIMDTLFVTVLIALSVSIATQVIRSKDFTFKFKWFIFYFLIYANIIWVMGEYVLPGLSYQAGVFSSLVVGFTLAAVIDIVQKLRLKYDSAVWVTIILTILLLVLNIESLHLGSIDQFFMSSANMTSAEDSQSCPTPMSGVIQFPWVMSKSKLSLGSTGSQLNNLIDTSVWRIEANTRKCYQGKYVGQQPDSFYCDDMVVSRWETDSSGAIKYRWYTAVSAEFENINASFYSPQYRFKGFDCENGQKVVVRKDVTDYYVYESKDGTQIRIKY